MKKNYPTNLTESQYEAILAIISDKRKHNHTLKEIFDAILYLLKTDNQPRSKKSLADADRIHKVSLVILLLLCGFDFKQMKRP